MEKRYYWLKLKRDFFKRHDIRIIESMPNGKDYILFYLKLLCESVDHDGTLRFSEEIPYNEEMLSTITNTNVDIVRSAIKIFTELGMMELLDDGTFFMNEVQKMIGKSSQDDFTRESTRLRVQAHRERKRLERYSNVTCNGELEKEIDIEKDKERNIKERNRFTPPTLEEVKEYCNERHNKVDAERFIDFYSAKGWMVGKNKMKDWKACIRTWEKRESAGKEVLPKYMNEPKQKKVSDEATLNELKEEIERLRK